MNYIHDSVHAEVVKKCLSGVKKGFSSCELVRSFCSPLLFLSGYFSYFPCAIRNVEQWKVARGIGWSGVRWGIISWKWRKNDSTEIIKIINHLWLRISSRHAEQTEARKGEQNGWIVDEVKSYPPIQIAFPFNPSTRFCLLLLIGVHNLWILTNIYFLPARWPKTGLEAERSTEVESYFQILIYQSMEVYSCDQQNKIKKEEVEGVRETLKRIFFGGRGQ